MRVLRALPHFDCRLRGDWACTPNRHLLIAPGAACTFGRGPPSNASLSFVSPLDRRVSCSSGWNGTSQIDVQRLFQIARADAAVPRRGPSCDRGFNPRRQKSCGAASAMIDAKSYFKGFARVQATGINQTIPRRANVSHLTRSNTTGTDFYICGSAAMVADCRGLLARAGATRVLTETD